MIGLSENSQEKELIVNKGSEIVKYTVQEEIVDRALLESELAMLQSQLNIKKPTNDELVAYAKASHPYYVLDIEPIQKRIDELNILLGN